MAGVAYLEQNMRATVNAKRREAFRDYRRIDPTRGYCVGMADALARLESGRRGQPTDDDRPPPSTFPSTAASREAMRYARQSDT